MVIVDTDSDMELVLATMHAIKAWNFVAGKELLIYGGRAKITTDKPVGFAAVVEDDLIFRLPQVTGVHIPVKRVGGHCRHGNLIRVRPSILTDSRAYYRNVIMHEMGHALGLHHHQGGGWVMSREFKDDLDGTELEISAYSREILRGLYAGR
jgi:hypothetical protein